MKIREAISAVAETFVGRQGRKVAFGVWGFWVANYFLREGKILELTWWKVFITCALLIGFGTLLDPIVKNLGAAICRYADSVLAKKYPAKNDDSAAS